ncbi:hypothetical protein CO2235_MP20167 [Cupriavidus oxalaticus]|uniref:Uncharacterized protein n=1 Tax=Cupriavidus oxalaticus TaxID=96344 RepID=A0A375FUY6_9BURK|nr:hypothetical protein CO2235_U990003 [Cupriavidus oxalaticus]SPC19756.1 hypothetical protein CO2235_MP20167 [Cupriavidus oxalaticus]
MPGRNLPDIPMRTRSPLGSASRCRSMRKSIAPTMPPPNPSWRSGRSASQRSLYRGRGIQHLLGQREQRRGGWRQPLQKLQGKHDEHDWHGASFKHTWQIPLPGPTGSVWHSVRHSVRHSVWHSATRKLHAIDAVPLSGHTGIPHAS